MRSLVLKTMKYKLILSDYGETLVHTGEDIHFKNKEAIHKYTSDGGTFVIATGREWPSIKRKMIKEDLMDSNILIVCMYGALIISSKSEIILSKHIINNEVVIKIIKFLNGNYHYSIVTKDQTLILSGTDVSRLVWKQYNNQMRFNDEQELIEYISSKSPDIYKIDIYELYDSYDVMQTIKKNYLGNFNYFINKDLKYLELVSEDSSKELAYLYLKAHFNLLEDEIIVIGDALNDLGMFKKAKNRVAVSNAIKEIIDESTMVIDNHDYCGIYRLIDKLM